MPHWTAIGRPRVSLFGPPVRSVGRRGARAREGGRRSIHPGRASEGVGGAGARRAVLTGSGPMILAQYYLGCLAHASYLIADQVSRQAAVIDPQCAIKQYLLDAEQLDCTIGHVVLTHLHPVSIAAHPA